jgi:hypothetical protein
MRNATIEGNFSSIYSSLMGETLSRSRSSLGRACREISESS